MQTRRLAMVGGLLVLTAAGIIYARTSGTLGGAADAPRPATAAQSRTSAVTASGTLVPARWARLGLPLGGRVAEVLVAEGDEVKANTPLVRLDAEELTHAEHQARAALDTAQKEVARLEAGASSEEVAAADAALRAALADVARLGAGARPEETAGVDADVRAAEAELARIKAGAKPEEVAAAKATMEKAAAVVRSAQSAFDKIAWLPDAGASSQAVALEQATATYSAAKAAYDAMVRGAIREEIAAAEARVDRAKAQLALVKSGARQEELSGARARADQARAQLARLRAGARPEELATAKSRVEAARATLQGASARLAQATLAAPIAGTVARVDVRAGEVVMPGQAVVTLGDLGALRVETDDLSEEDVARLKVSAPVKVTLDALPGRVILGQVLAIAPMAGVERADQRGTNYKVTVDLKDPDPAMRWGMTAYVEVVSK